MRIHLLCDQKWRDLPNLTAIKLRLEEYGHRVLLSTTKDAVPMIKAVRPDCVVINHLFATSNQKLAGALSASGVAVVVLPTEGAVRPELRSLSDGEFSNYRVMNLHLAWSEPAAEGIRIRWGFDESSVPVIGCTRFDFYTPQFKSTITSREEFCRQYGLDPKRPIVTWATAYNFADIDKHQDTFAKFIHELNDTGVGNCYQRIRITPEGLSSSHARERRANSSAFMGLAAARPDVQFIIRPHPTEFRDFYRTLIAEYGLRNVRFCPQDYIWNVLNASNLHLHRHCTTAVEAWMWDKPTIEMAIEASPELSWRDRELGSNVIETADALITTVDRYLGGEKIDDTSRAYRRNYIQTWFGPADGCRCAAAAQAINTFLAVRGQRRSYWMPYAGLSASPRQVATAVVRYALGKRPNEPLLRRVPESLLDPQDRHIRRPDVRRYKRLLASSVSQEAVTGCG